MATDGEHALSTRRKRRGVVRASVTRLDSRVSELERKKKTSPGDLATAQCFLRKLDELDEEFKSYHLSIVDLIGEESIDTEQGILDDHDDKVASIFTIATVHLEALVCPFLRIHGFQPQATPHPTIESPRKGPEAGCDHSRHDNSWL